MGIKIPQHIETSIIDAWMMGNTRDSTASEFNISSGSVSNIIERWQNRIGVFDAKNLRTGVSIKKGRNITSPMR